MAELASALGYSGNSKRTSYKKIHKILKSLALQGVIRAKPSYRLLEDGVTPVPTFLLLYVADLESNLKPMTLEEAALLDESGANPE